MIRKFYHSRSAIWGVLLSLLISSTLPEAFAQDDAEKKKNDTEAPKVEEKKDAQPEPVIENEGVTIVPRRGRRRTAIRNDRDHVSVGSDAELRKNESASQMVVIMGNATVDGDVDHDLVVVGGTLKLNGKVGNDVVVVLGSTTLGPEADVGGDVVTVGGTITRQKGSQVSGSVVPIPIFPGLKGGNWVTPWFSHGLLLGRPLPPDSGGAWLAVGLFFGLYLLASLAFPRPIQASLDILDKKPVAAFFTGILGFVLCGPVMLLLAISVLGLLVIPFLICGLIGAVILGKAAVLRFFGLQVARQTGLGVLENVLFSLLLGGALLCLLYMVPIVGFVTWGVVTPLGFGAALLAAFGMMKKEQAPPAPIQFASATGGAAAAGATAGAVPGMGVPPMGSEPGTIALPPLTSPDVVSLPRVGFWLRFLATFLDFVLLCWLIALKGPFFIIFWCAYHVGMWAWKGTTIGGLLIRLKVVRTDGRPVDFAVALVRSLSSIFSFMVLCLGFFWVGWDRDRQSWHDKIAGTVVVRVPKSMSLL